MKKDNWLDIINEIDDKYLKMIEGEPRVMENIFKRNIQKVLAVASILVLVGISAFAISIKMGKPGEDIAGVNTETEEEKIVGALESTEMEAETTEISTNTDVETAPITETLVVSETDKNLDIEVEETDIWVEFPGKEEMDVVYELPTIASAYSGSFIFWIGQKGSSEYLSIDREDAIYGGGFGGAAQIETNEGFNKENKRRVVFLFLDEKENEGTEEITTIAEMMIYNTAWDDAEMYAAQFTRMSGADGPGADKIEFNMPEGFMIEGKIGEYSQEKLLEMECYRGFMEKAVECTEIAVIEADGTVTQIPSEEINKQKICEIMFPMYN